jgi:death-on-curing protein
VKPTLFPTLEEAIKLHDLLIERFGGEPGVRDMGLLESALGRPRTGYYASLSLQAGALLQSLARNHAFLDGNKRMAFALCAVFLRMNGCRLVVEPDDGEAFLVQEVIAGHAELAVIADWLERHVVEVT